MYSAINEAARNGHTEIFKLLTEQEINLTIDFSRACSPAAWFGYIEILKLLIARGSNINEADEYIDFL